jgi:tetratricopeptide (TPR) repeat protein
MRDAWMPGNAQPNLVDSGRTLEACTCLIIDTNQTSRSLMRGMMAELGMQAITQAARVGDARRALETRTFDVVLCDYHFDDSDITGADLLEDLRRANLLPFSTIFIMVTGEASYAKVAEAAESALDSYLIKPHTVNELALRLRLARHRKVVLGSIFEAIEQEDFEVAADLCVKRFQNRDEYWLYAARIGGEVLLRLGRHDQARDLFKAINDAKTLPWARLGIARAQLDGGHTQPARRTLESLIGDHPTYADAYDVMGRVQLQSGQFEQSYDTFQRAVENTPSSIARLQKAGMLAFYLGQNDEASRMLERATSLGISSKMYDFQSLVMLAQMRFVQKDSKGVHRCRANLAHVCEKQPHSTRLKRMLNLVSVLVLMLQRQVAEVVSAVKSMAGEISSPDFDFEAATNFLSLLVRLRASELELPDAELWVNTLALRFCVSKATTDLLSRNVSNMADYELILRDSYKKMVELAENSLAHAKTGKPQGAVKALLAQGAKTHNAKLLELADMVLNRYLDQFSEAEYADISTMIKDLLRSHCGQRVAIQLGADTGRQSGSLTLRSKVPQAQAPAAPALTQST